MAGAHRVRTCNHLVEKGRDVRSPAVHTHVTPGRPVPARPLVRLVYKLYVVCGDVAWRGGGRSTRSRDRWPALTAGGKTGCQN